MNVCLLQVPLRCAPKPYTEPEMIAVKRERREGKTPAQKNAAGVSLERTHTYMYISVHTCRYLHAKDAVDDHQKGKERMKHDVRCFHTQAYVMM